MTIRQAARMGVRLGYTRIVTLAGDRDLERWAGSCNYEFVRRCGTGWNVEDDYLCGPWRRPEGVEERRAAKERNCDTIRSTYRLTR